MDNSVEYSRVGLAIVASQGLGAGVKAGALKSIRQHTTVYIGSMNILDRRGQSRRFAVTFGRSTPTAAPRSPFAQVVPNEEPFIV